MVLTRADLGRFLSALSRRLPCPAALVLTGGGEALLLGGTRPTGDVDFGLALAPGRGRHLAAVEAAIAEAAPAPPCMSAAVHCKTFCKDCRTEAR
jgi:hypothetical protein